MTENQETSKARKSNEIGKLAQEYDRWRIAEDEKGKTASEYSERALEKLLEISSFLHRIHERSELLSYVSDRLREFFDAQNSFVILFDEDGAPEILESNLASGRETDPLISSTVLQRVCETRFPLVISDTSKDPGLSRRTSIEYLRISSVMCAPLIVADEVIGVLQFDHRGEAHAFPASDVRLLQLFADQIATAVHNLQLIEGRRRALEETRRAQAKLVQSERLAAVGRLAAGVAHDFNNTLFIALGQCDILLEGADLSTQAREAVERVQSSAMDAARTVQRLQTLGPGPPRMTLDSAVAVDEVLRELPELTREKWFTQARSRGLNLKLEVITKGGMWVAAEPADIREIMMNLIFNAVESMSADGTVALESRVLDDSVQLIVRDEGCGMSPEQCQRAFEPFFSTKSGRGHGLGLATSWSIAESMGGTLSLRSRVGIGTEVYFQLPRAEPVTTQTTRLEGEKVAPLEIAIVDDDEAVRSTLEGMLRAAGHRVVAYASGEECLKDLARQEADLVLTDLRMPGMGGRQLAAKLQQTRPELPIVFLTGDETRIRGEHPKNVRASFAKPVGIQDLRDLLGRVRQMS